MIESGHFEIRKYCLGFNLSILYIQIKRELQSAIEQQVCFLMLLLQQIATCQEFTDKPVFFFTLKSKVQNIVSPYLNDSK